MPAATPRSTLVRYTLYQIPEWVLAVGAAVLLHRWGILTGWPAALLVAGVMAKDAALYPLLRTAYETDASTAIERLIGLSGVAVEPLTPHGYVRVRGELWRSEATAAGREIRRGHPVTVQAVRGTTLLVRPAPRRGGSKLEENAAEGR